MIFHFALNVLESVDEHLIFSREETKLNVLLTYSMNIIDTWYVFNQKLSFLSLHNFYCFIDLGNLTALGVCKLWYFYYILFKMLIQAAYTVKHTCTPCTEIWC